MKPQTIKRLRLTLLFALINFSIMLISVGICIAWTYVFKYTQVANTQEVTFILLAFAMRSVIVGTIVAILVSRVPLEPLQEVMDVADRIADGDYSVRLRPHGLKVLKELESSFNHMAEELDGVEILRSDFINNFSHEFRTPITSICGYAEILKNGTLTEQERSEYLDIIIGESRRLSDLSTNIMNLSALERQCILTGKARLNVSEQLRLAAALLYEKCQAKDVEIDFDAEEFYVIGNGDLLKQVWINLLDNAIKFADPHTEIKTGLCYKGAMLAVSISNQGKAIPEADLERVFHRFYQCDKSHTAPGNGIGLAIVHRIVALHSGTVHAQSSPDGRTTFEVLLPLPENG